MLLVVDNKAGHALLLSSGRGGRPAYSIKPCDRQDCSNISCTLYLCNKDPAIEHLLALSISY